MAYYFSPSELGFFHSDIFQSLPDDATEISEDKYNELINGQGEGKLIVAAEDGTPRLLDADTRVTVESARKLATRQLDSARASVEDAGVTSNGIRFVASNAGLSNLTSAIDTAALTGDSHVDYNAADGWVEISVEGLVAARLAVAAQIKALNAAQKAQAAAIAAATTVAELRAIDFSQGWPTATL